MLLVCGLWLVLAHGAAAADGWRAHLSAKLQSVYQTRSQSSALALASSSGGARLDTQGRIQADVHYDCGGDSPAAALAAAGFSVSGSARFPPLCAIEGWTSLASLPRVAAIPGVTQVRIPSYARHVPRPAGAPLGPIGLSEAVGRARAKAQASSTINGKTVSIMHADQFVSQAGSGGTGVTVGIQSAGVYSLSAIQGRGELPSVSVVTSAAGASATSADEGTVLLEEVHAVAPSAKLAFCEPQTFIQYLACLQQFVSLGATVMADDIVFLDQDPLSSGGTDPSSGGLDAQGLSQFLAQNPNVMLFTAAGNDNGSYYEGAYDPLTVAQAGISPLSCPSAGSTQTNNYVHRFSASAVQNLTTNQDPGIAVPLTFAWGDASGTGQNFEVYWVSQSNPNYSGCVSLTTQASAVLTQTIDLYAGDNTVYVATKDASLAGKYFKLWVGGDGLSFLSIPTQGSVVSPQAFATGAISVGAVNGSDGVGNTIEAFSSRGPIHVLFPTVQDIQAPVLTAPDGVYVDAAGTNFANNLFPDGNFYGTSASAPNAAAVAALIRGAFPKLTVAQVLSALATGATQLGAAKPDGTFGYGRIDAMGALATFTTPTMTALSDVTIDASSSTKSAPVSFTVNGTGDLHFVVTSTNTTLVPTTVTLASSSAAGGGTPGVTVSPADCGSTTLTCSLIVTAANYQGGTTTLTVSATDGGGRQAPATMKVTLNNPQPAPPPPPPTTTSTNSGGGGGGAIEWWTLAALGFSVALQRSRG